MLESARNGRAHRLAPGDRDPRRSGRRAEALIDAVGKLRRTLDRFDWLAAGWLSQRTVRTNTSSLKLSLVMETDAVSTAARKLGGHQVVRLAGDIDRVRPQILAVIDPPNHAGAPEAGRQLSRLLDEMLDAATKATRRKRIAQALVVAAFVVGAALGFVLGLLVGSAR